MGTTNKSETGLDVKFRLNICSGVANGIAYLHATRPQVVHQDIKPANVLICEKTKLAKLTDFGLAREKASHAYLSQWQIGGTKKYLAPEVVAGEKASTAVDVWGLGWVVFELTNGI